jgi:DAK2 domain fusion protein YloV
VPQTLDAAAVRRWCQASLDALGLAREEIDALNVFPVPDGDTGTNLYLTMESAHAALAGVTPGPVVGPDTASADVPSDQPGLGPEDQGRAALLRAMAHGALVGARGNSGVILSQLLRGLAEVLGEPGVCDGERLRAALRNAADVGWAAVVSPVEGTVLSVARAAAEGATASACADLDAVAVAAAQAARLALARTPDQLPVLRRAGVVDAGGRGLTVVLDALAAVLAGADVPRAAAGRVPVADLTGRAEPAGPAYEVIYLLDAEQDRIPALRDRLAGLGDSAVVVGGDGLWNVHVHVDDVGAAIEAGVEAGRPHRIRVNHFGDLAARRAAARGDEREPEAEPVERAVVAVAYGDGLAALLREAGAQVVPAAPGQPPSTQELVAALRRARAREVVLLPNDPGTHGVAGVAAAQLAADGVRVAVLPTKASVQGIAALAVHQPGRRFDQDVVAMTAAAGATRYGALTVAAEQSLTMVGVCQAGDVLGLIEGDVALIGADQLGVARTVLERMLSAGGEMVTLVTGQELADGLADALAADLSASRPEVDVVVYAGGQKAYPLLIGVE